MIRLHANELIILLGLLLVCYGAANVVSNHKQVITNKAQAALRQVAEDDSNPSVHWSDRSVATELNPDLAPAMSPINDVSQVKAYEPAGQSEEIKRLLQMKKHLDPFLSPSVPAVPEIPSRLVIPAIALDAPVIPVDTQFVKVGDKEYSEWLAPDQFAVGWHTSSAHLGDTGNTVFNGHHNIYGGVFAGLVDLIESDLIWVYSHQNLHLYTITNKMILQEKYQQLDVRMENAQWIFPSQDERLTLVTCWPQETNTHRLVIVAKPLPYEQRDSNMGQNIRLR